MTTQYTKITFGSLFDLLNFIVLHSPITWVLLRHRWMYIKNAFKVVGREFAERKNGSYSFKMLRYLRNTLFDKSKKNLLAAEFFFFFFSLKLNQNWETEPICIWRNLVFQVVGKYPLWPLYLRMFWRGLWLKTTVFLAFFLWFGLTWF